jgi:hypothetical protein
MKGVGFRRFKEKFHLPMKNKEEVFVTCLVQKKSSEVTK